MAQSPDGTGTAPVRITKSSTSVTSGLGVTQKLVGAAIAFGNVLRGTLVQTDWIKCSTKQMEKRLLLTMVQKL